MSAIRIAITDEIQEAIEDLKQNKYSVLSSAEIFKLWFALLYSNYKSEKDKGVKWWNSLDTINISTTQKKSISEARKWKMTKMTSEEFSKYLDR